MVLGRILVLGHMLQGPPTVPRNIDPGRKVGRIELPRYLRHHASRLSSALLSEKGILVNRLTSKLAVAAQHERWKAAITGRLPKRILSKNGLGTSPQPITTVQYIYYYPLYMLRS